MSEREPKREVRPQIRGAHELLLELRARMGFWAYAPPEALRVALRLRETLRPLVEEAGRRVAPQEVGRLTENVLDRLDELIHSGNACAFCMDYIQKQFLAVRKAEQPDARWVEFANDSADPRTASGTTSDLEDSSVVVGGLLLREDQQTFRSLYQELRQTLEEPELQLLDYWIAASGEKAWRQRLAEETYRRQSTFPAPRRITQEQIRSKIDRLWYKVRDRICSIFAGWLVELAAANGNAEQQRDVEKPKVLANLVLQLIQADGSRAGPADGRVNVPAAPKVPASPSDWKQDQSMFRRSEQRAGMYSRARQRSDRPLYAILTCYAEGKSAEELLQEVYEVADAIAQERLKDDLAILHSWYEDLTHCTQEKVDAWDYYHGMRHGGLLRFRKLDADLPDFERDYEPILHAAEKDIPFLALPDRVGFELDTVVARVLRLKELIGRGTNLSQNCERESEA